MSRKYGTRKKKAKKVGRPSLVSPALCEEAYIRAQMAKFSGDITSQDDFTLKFDEIFQPPSDLRSNRAIDKPNRKRLYEWFVGQEGTAGYFFYHACLTKSDKAVKQALLLEEEEDAPSEERKAVLYCLPPVAPYILPTSSGAHNGDISISLVRLELEVASSHVGIMRKGCKQTCYANSIIEILSQNTTLTTDLQNVRLSNNSICRALGSALITRYQCSSLKTAVAVEKVLLILGTRFPQAGWHDPFRRQDCAELLGFVFRLLEEEIQLCLHPTKVLARFTAKFVCPNGCLQVPVNILPGMLGDGVIQCLAESSTDLVTQGVEAIGATVLICPEAKCNARLVVSQYPSTLFFGIHRSVESAGLGVSLKINFPVIGQPPQHCPIMLNPSDVDAIKAEKPDNLVDSKIEYNQYKLVGVVCHDADQAHYTAVVWREPQSVWLLYDDAKTPQLLNIDQVLSKAAAVGTLFVYDKTH